MSNNETENGKNSMSKNEETKKGEKSMLNIEETENESSTFKQVLFSTFKDKLYVAKHVMLVVYNFLLLIFLFSWKVIFFFL